MRHKLTKERIKATLLKDYKFLLEALNYERIYYELYTGHVKYMQRIRRILETLKAESAPPAFEIEDLQAENEVLQARIDLLTDQLKDLGYDYKGI